MKYRTLTEIAFIVSMAAILFAMTFPVFARGREEVRKKKPVQRRSVTKVKIILEGNDSILEEIDRYEFNSSSMTYKIDAKSGKRYICPVERCVIIEE